MPDELTPEAQAEALLQSEGFTVTPPDVAKDAVPAEPVAPAPDAAPVAPPTEPLKSSSLWKPLPQEFFLEEIEALAADISPDFSAVHFTMSDTEQDGVPGHTLTASVK